MRLALKILKITAILILTLSVILFSASLLLKDKVAGVILTSFNKSLSTKIDIGSFRLSFLRKFPNASLELKNVTIHSSKNFNSEQFKGINTDTLLTARLISVEFSITDIINGNYNIERVSARNGKVNLFSDISGFVNYDISVKSENPGNEIFTINLERINLDNIDGYYNNLATRLVINGLVKTGKLKSRISGDNIDFTATAETVIKGFQLFNTSITKQIKAGLDISLNSTKEGIKINKGTLEIDNYSFGLDGFVSADDFLDLEITGNNLDITKIRNYLPEKYQNLVAEYNPSGILVANCKVKGPLTRTKNPHIEVEFSLKNGQVSFGKSNININNLSFSGHFTNGSKNLPVTCSVSIHDFTGRLGSADYSGSMAVSDFNKPLTRLTLKGKLFPLEIKEFFDLKNITSARGFADFDMNLTTDFWPAKKISFKDIAGLKPEGILTFNSFSIGTDTDHFLVEKINGNVKLAESIKAENLSFNYKGQQIRVSGEFKNLPEWVAGEPVKLIATADVEFDRFIPEAFIDTVSNKSSAQKAFSLPDDMVLGINFSIDRLNYKTFSSTRIKGSLSYKPRLLTFSTINLEALDGLISGNGFIVQNLSKSVMTRGNFILNNIDVKKAFTTFHNFGQSFIKAENLSGDLSGTLSVLLPLDSLLNADIKTMTAEGKYTLLNGALTDFGPVKELSSFIELSELENIHFEKLENDFFIKNNFLYVPQMDVKSSAADLSVNGKHSFDNDYEYHVKMLLSEILSKKRKKIKGNNTEFGVVEDDGLGRTSILLKIISKGDDFKVSYDLKAASAGVKNNIRTERQTLKTILNQEYGWFKNDTTTKAKPAEKKSRFRISFEGTDTTNMTPDSQAVKKTPVLKNLLKKKKE